MPHLVTLQLVAAGPQLWPSRGAVSNAMDAARVALALETAAANAREAEEWLSSGAKSVATGAGNGSSEAVEFLGYLWVNYG